MSPRATNMGDDLASQSVSRSNGWTEGPWSSDDRVVGWWGGEQPGCMVRFYVGNSGRPIANCLSQATGDKEAVANAHLIAAAPCLYEALLQYRDDLRHPPEGDSRDRRLERVNALLSRARGEA